MSEIPTWRERILKIGIILALVNPIYFIVALGLASRMPNGVWADQIGIGVLTGVVSLLCGLVGTGAHRWKTVTAASCETAVWWFMAVGL